MTNTATSVLEIELPAPPLPPRTISDNFTWRLILTNGWAISALVFILMGGIFLPVGIALTVGIISAFVGIPFIGTGFLLIGAGISLFLWQYKEAQKIVHVLRDGISTQGEISDVSMNPSLEVNGHHQWTISYIFQHDGHDYRGKISTLNPPGLNLQHGQPACILYLPESPDVNSIYPHP